MNAIYKFLLISISKLPLSFLYGISDMLYRMHSLVIKYRTEVVLNNISNAFPNKSKHEIEQISKQFYRNFYDFIMESVKGITINQKNIDCKISVEGLEIMQKYHDQGKNVMVLCGHLFNWEWLKGLGAHVPQENIYAVYSVPKSKLVNEIISKSREKFGGETIPMQEAKKTILQDANYGKSLYLMVADQSPYKTKIKYDLKFLNQTTPVFQGFDKIARKNNLGVVYLNITRKARGKYHYQVVDVLPQHKYFEENEIVHQFYQLLEENILQNPSNYMWTHRRWKYKKGVDY